MTVTLGLGFSVFEHNQSKLRRGLSLFGRDGVPLSVGDIVQACFAFTAYNNVVTTIHRIQQ